MNPVLVGSIGLAVFFIILFIGVPVYACMLLVGICGFAVLTSVNAAFSQVSISAFNTITDYNLAVLPFFIFMGQIIIQSQISGNLFEFFRRTIGRFRGGLAMATIGGGAAMALMSHSLIVVGSTMALVAGPEMEKSHYGKSLAAGTIVSGGTLGLLFPPSGILIMYGVLTGTSIINLFIGSLVPAIIMTILLIAAVYVQCLIKPELGPAGPKYGIKEILRALGGCGEGIFLIVFCIVGIIVGWFTPTEGGAVGAAGALIVAMVRRKLTWQGFKAAIFGTLAMVGMVYGLVMGAFIFQGFTALSTIPAALASFITGLGWSPVWIMLAIILLYLLLGTFMDEVTMVLVTIPIFFPISQALGFDAVWFGIIVVIVMMAGAISPPTGMVMFIIAKMLKIPITTMYKGVWPFFGTMVTYSIILLFVPGIITFLPGIINH